jgi:hypothetical protein
LLGAVVLAPGLASAVQIVPIPVTAAVSTTGTNTAALRVRLTCSGALCSLAGFGSPFDQTQTSTLTGGGNLYMDDSANTVQFSSDAAGTLGLASFVGSNVTFTGIPVLGNVTTTSITVFTTNAPVTPVAGMDLRFPPDDVLNNYPITVTGYNVGANVLTSNTTLPSISLPATPINMVGNLVEQGDGDLDLQPSFAIQNLRGAFQFTSSTSISGVTINATFWATFTLNMAGEAAQAFVPEPASGLLVGVGILGFAASAWRRRKS